MILGGAEVLKRNLVHNLPQSTQQQQPCGIDLTLRQISVWTSGATIDFDNSKRQGAATSPLAFTEDGVKLQAGAYLVDFNETVEVPRNCMATIYPRSPLWRSGILISAGVVDAGYHGALGALMEVKNPHGLTLFENAKLAQIVFHEMAGEVEGYAGIYQGSITSTAYAGLEGTKG